MFKFIDKYIGIPLVFLLGVLYKITPHKTICPAPGRILIIKTSALGDTVLLMPVIKAMRETYKDSKITMIVTAKNYNVLRHFPYVDGLFVLEIKKLINPLYLIEVVLKIREFKPDIAIDFDQWLRLSPILAYFSGAKKRLGFKTKGQSRHYLYTDYVEHNKEEHESQCFVNLVRLLGVGVKNKKIELFTGVSDKDEAEHLLHRISLGQSDLIIGIHPGCGKKGEMRAWPAENYVELIKNIRKRFSAKIILTGTSEEYNLSPFLLPRVLASL